MTEGIERLIKISTLRDVEIALIQIKLNGQIVPDVVFETLKSLEAQYKK